MIGNATAAGAQTERQGGKGLALRLGLTGLLPFKEKAPTEGSRECYFDSDFFAGTVIPSTRTVPST
jgi:hypothetical protein